jgi:predicted AAA+ superfamily ATPase
MSDAMFERNKLKTITKRIREPRKFIQVILGPRQVGKTTLAEQLTSKLSIPNLFVTTDAVPPSNTAWIDQQWEAARIKLSSSGAKQFLLIIDEIQKILNWSETVKKNWDTDTRNQINIKVLLLGSSSLSIQSGLTESLAGRFEVTLLPHWSFNEMKEAFGFTPDQYVYYGAYPGGAELIEQEKRWADYIRYSIIETTISKDILQLTSIQKPALLKNLFELSCIYSGQILSYTKMLGQLHDAGNTTTLAHYQELLDKSWMISGIQKFSGSRVTIKSSIPKWLVYNSAIASVYSDSDFNESKNQQELWGRRVEQAIGSYLLNQARLYGVNIYYWREGNNEVDFILKKGDKIISIEVKTSKVNFHKGLENFQQKHNTYKNILISNDSLSWSEFLTLDINLLFK